LDTLFNKKLISDFGECQKIFGHDTYIRFSF